jgi:uncharacterized protein (TIGR04255 family)
MPDIRYRNNFIKNAIFRLDFSPILSLTQDLNPAFQEALREEFPKLEELQGLEYKAKFQKGEKIDEQKEFKIWSFFNKEKTYKITISFQFIVIECFKYSHFDNFRQISDKAYSTFLSLYKPLDNKRLGLRYINKIELPEGHPLEWKQFVKDFLVYSIENYDGDKSQLSRAMSQFVLNKGEHILTFSYGISNDEFPTPISRKEFILDYDCSTKDVDESQVIEKLNLFNTDIVALFEKCITDELRAKMEVINE